MKVWFAAFLCVCVCGEVFSQTIQAEVFAGESSYYYQHVVAKRFSDSSRIGFFNTSSMLAYYDRELGTEVMSQIYVTYSLSRKFTAGMGSIYVSGKRLLPSITLQYFTRFRDVTWLVAPRADISKNASVELMTMLEYRPAIGRGLRVYSRIQLMTNWGATHNRSYQYLRIGLDYKMFQFGLGAAVDQYGRYHKTYTNYGVFVRKALD